jgi:hypothetical protein
LKLKEAGRLAKVEKKVKEVQRWEVVRTQR